jgi:hypothetical protein
MNTANSKFSKGDRVMSTEYGEGVIVKGPLFGYVNENFDSEPKYDVVCEGGRFPYRLFESALILIPKISRKEKNDIVRQGARDRAVAEGWAMHVNRSEGREIDPSENFALFEALVDLCFRMGASLVLTSPASISEACSLEMGNFVIPVSEDAHGLKCNVAVENSRALGDLQRDMGFNVHTDNGFSNGFSEVEICSKELARALGQRGVISERSLRKPVEETEYDQVGSV